jgi:type IV pilus modification protein PilV|tara:strand:- start:634 stop:1800 length:1167 start_codon:yes stop_codon:yes gene_type:complete
MSSLNRSRPHTAKIKSIQGFTLIEVLVTLVITAIALFGFVELQNRAQIANLEATQRAYATMIASNMAEQIKANPEIGADCNLTASFDVGSGHGTWNHPCESGNNSVKEWHKDLRGNRETTNSGNQKIGSIKNGHGCINYTAAVPASGTPAKYTVSVAWKGFQKTAAGGPSGSCGFGEYGDSGYHRLMSLDVYPQSLPIACSQPPAATSQVGYQNLSDGSHVIEEGEVAHILGSRTFNGSIAVRSGGHLVVSGSSGIFGSVNINSGGHYWRTSTTGFTGSLAMNGTEHIEPEGCNWFPLSACGVNVNSCENGGTISGHDNRNSNTCFKESVNWTTHPHLNGNTLTVLGGVVIGNCGGGFSSGGGTIRTTGYTTATCTLPSSVTIERCAQ